MDNPLTIYVLDIKGQVIATSQAVHNYRSNSAKKFLKSIPDGLEACVRRAEGDYWYIHDAKDTRHYESTIVATADLPKPFQMYLMLLGE